MRFYGALLVLLALIVASGFWTSSYLNASAREISGQIDQVTKEIKHDRWGKARQETVALESTWVRESRWWPVFLDHEEMDKIQFSVARVKEYVTNRNYPLSMGQLAELKAMINHIPDLEGVTLENLL